MLEKHEEFVSHDTRMIYEVFLCSFVTSKLWEIIPTDFKKLPYTSFYKQYKLYLLNTQYHSSA